MIDFTIELTEAAAIREANDTGELSSDWSMKRKLDFISCKMSASRHHVLVEDYNVPAFLARIKLDGYEVVGAKCVTIA